MCMPVLHVVLLEAPVNSSTNRIFIFQDFPGGVGNYLITDQ